MSFDRELLRSLPKVLLHDHLDGGLRPATVVDLAAAVGHQLPAQTPQELAAWWVEAVDSGSLERYLETFVHTLAVMQTRAGLIRVAREAVVDMAADGVVYAESRFAPEQHCQAGLSLQEVVDAVRAGLAEGMDEAAAAGHRIRVEMLLCAMRQANNSDAIAELALANRHRGVVGFDIAGPEAGFPPTNHRRAFTLLREANFPYTIHAGEAAEQASLWEAIQRCWAVRIGHGVLISRDIEGWQTPETAVLGPLAHWVRDRRIPLEVCPTSNLQTGLAANIAAHPITALKRLGFAVTLNTDNRLMSGTTASREAGLLMAEAGWTLADLRDVTVTGMRAGFIHDDEREDIVANIIQPAYDAALAA